MWSLSLQPKAGGIGNYGSSATWKTVYDRFSLSNQWATYRPQGADTSMRKQYDCHFWYGMIKTPWDLEPSRKAENIDSITYD